MSVQEVRQAFGEFEFRILFYRYGYSPHYAEHVVDPRDGREKLVLAIPHTTPKASTIVIYDLRRDVIEWEFTLPGGEASTNPHVAHMVADVNPVTGSWIDVAGIINAEPGDIVAPARDNTWVVIDRDRKAVKYKLKPLFKAHSVHDIVPSRDGKSLIVSDWGSNLVAKIDPRGPIEWSREIFNASKISVVEAVKGSPHNPSFGGDYVVASNRAAQGVHEVRDSDGVEVWVCGSYTDKPGFRVNTLWPGKPHSAFRTGLAENEGNLTIIGFEAGGGIVAVDSDCRPRWGIAKPFTFTFSEPHREVFRPTSYGLAETTHVFPTLRGTIGFVDWGGKFGSIVGEIVRIPYHQTLVWFLAQDHDPGDGGYFYDPPIEVAEWETVKLFFINLGDNPLQYTVYATYMPGLFPWDFPSHWRIVAKGAVDPHSNTEVDVSGYTAIRVFGARARTGSASKWKIVVVQRR